MLFLPHSYPVAPHAYAAFAYDTELSDIAVREAYFLGQRNDEKTRTFFAPYTQHLPLPKKGPYVSEIRLLTPLAQVVQASSQTHPATARNKLNWIISPAAIPCS